MSNGILTRFLRLHHLSPLAVLTAALLVAGCGNGEELYEDADGNEIQQAEEGGPWASPESDEPATVVPSGTRLVFEVVDEVSTSSHEQGDAFELRLVRAVEGTGGLVVPEGARARGTVTAAQRSSSENDEAVLAVRVESIRVDGRDRALNGQVTAADTESAARDSGARTAAKVATGAAAGAIVGQILGRDTRSTVQGAAAGAVAGLGIALTTRDGHAVLPKGSLVTVQLDDALVVNSY